MAAISSLSSAERPLAISTIVAAFAAEQVERGLWPEAYAHSASFPDFVAAFGGDALDHGTGWRVTDSGP